jgi:hypothetical protein
MRTKTLLLTAALVAAGVASSMAQSNVYSLNIVGYININVKPGFNLISLPLQNADTNSSINSVLTNTSPVMPGGAFVSTWNPTSQSFNQAVYAGGDGNWYDAGFNFTVTNPLVPGQGFFLNMPTVANGGVSNLTITVVGSVLAGTNNLAITKGYGFYGDPLPLVREVTTNGFPVTSTSFLQFFNAGVGYAQAVYGVSAVDNGTPNPQFYDASFVVPQTVAPGVGQGFLYFFGSTTNATWTQTFNVGP